MDVTAGRENGEIISSDNDDVSFQPEDSWDEDDGKDWTMEQSPIIRNQLRPRKSNQ